MWWSRSVFYILHRQTPVTVSGSREWWWSVRRWHAQCADAARWMCVCPSADFISHTRSSPPSFRIFLRSGGGGVLRYVSLFVYVNKRVCSSARWTRLKARRACSMSGDKHTRRWDACSVFGHALHSQQRFGASNGRVPIQQQFWT